jgi:hypothetical protein
LMRSDPLQQLVRQPACTARTRHRRTACRPPSSLPAAAFGPLRISAPKADKHHLRRSQRLGTAFRSPGAAVRFRTTSPGSKFLACSFDAPLSLTTSPFGRRLLSSPSGLPAAGKINARNPLLAPRPAFRKLSGSCSPSGSLDPSGSSLAPVRLRKLASTKRPIARHSLPPKLLGSKRQIIVPNSLRSAWLAAEVAGSPLACMLGAGRCEQENLPGLGVLSAASCGSNRSLLPRSSVGFP